MAMLAGSTCPATSFASSSLQPPPLLDLADELWFSRSVLPFPSIPCLSPISFNSPPDTSTLLAQIMFSTVHRHSPTPSTSENLHLRHSGNGHRQWCQQGVDTTAVAPEGVEETLSGLYDVDVILRNQHFKGAEGIQKKPEGQDELNVMCPKEWHMMSDTTVQVTKQEKNKKGSTHGGGCKQVDATHEVPYASRKFLTNLAGKREKSFNPLHIPLYTQEIHNLSYSEQTEIKRQLKCWAQVVASTSHAKDLKKAKQARRK